MGEDPSLWAKARPQGQQYVVWACPASQESLARRWVTLSSDDMRQTGQARINKSVLAPVPRQLLTSPMAIRGGQAAMSRQLFAGPGPRPTPWCRVTQAPSQARTLPAIAQTPLSPTSTQAAVLHDLQVLRATGPEGKPEGVMASGLAQCQGIFCGPLVTGRWAKMCGLAEHRQRRRKDGPASTGTWRVETRMLAPCRPCSPFPFPGLAPGLPPCSKP